MAIEKVHIINNTSVIQDEVSYAVTIKYCKTIVISFKKLLFNI